jgi:hypothetical protein
MDYRHDWDKADQNSGFDNNSAIVIVQFPALRRSASPRPLARHDEVDGHDGSAGIERMRFGCHPQAGRISLNHFNLLTGCDGQAHAGATATDTRRLRHPHLIPPCGATGATALSKSRSAAQARGCLQQAWHA